MKWENIKGEKMEISEILSQYGKNSDKIYKMNEAKYAVQTSYFINKVLNNNETAKNVGNRSRDTMWLYITACMHHFYKK